MYTYIHRETEISNLSLFLLLATGRGGLEGDDLRYTYMYIYVCIYIYIYIYIYMYMCIYVYIYT